MEADLRVIAPQPEYADMTKIAIVIDLKQEKDLLAISFISPEDLERTYAPTGFLRALRPDYLHPQKEVSLLRADALNALEGRSSKNQRLSFRAMSMETGELSVHRLERNVQSEAAELAPINLQKTSSIRRLFRRTQSEPQLGSSKSCRLLRTRA